jgi:hypothetical protein
MRINSFPERCAFHGTDSFRNPCNILVVRPEPVILHELLRVIRHN